MKIFESQKSPFLAIAHRGDSYSAPENTMAAFKQAFKKGADMIELDVLLTKDGVPVVIHDNDLDKYGYPSSKTTDLTYEELQLLDVGSWFSPGFRGEVVPSLEKVLEWAGDRVLLNIEIKPESVSENTAGVVEELVIQLVKKYTMQDKVLISSFDYRALDRINAIDPEIDIGLLYNKELASELTPVELVKKYSATTFHSTWFEWFRLGSRPFMNNNIPVCIYTINNRWLMKRLIKKGVSGIFSDKPGLLKEVAEKVVGSSSV